jgi:outer membrane protein assembly factor BamB
MILLSCAVILVNGCSGLRLAYPLRPGELDTPTFAHNAARVNALPITITPPLTQVWEQDITAGIGSGSPLLVDSIIMVGNLRGELYALSANTGKRIGWVTLGGSIEGAPVVDGDLVIVPVAGSRETLIGYDFLDGKARWKAVLGDIHASPLLMDSRVFVGNASGRFTAVDRSTGEPVWHFDLPGNASLKGIRSSAAGAGANVVFGADDGRLYNLDARTGKVRWMFATDGAIQAAPSIADTAVFVGTLHGTMYAVGLAGGSLLWSYPSGAAIYAPPLVHTEACYVGTTGGVVIALNQRTGALLWSCDVHSPVNTGILAVNTVLYVGTLRKELIAIDAAKGTILWKGAVSGRIKTTPIAGGHRVYIATDDRLVQAFEGSVR